jgi:type IV pilus assembly protein PilM
VPEADILPLVLLDMEQYLPNIARDYRTGISILETTKVPTGSQIKVRVFAMPGTMADEYEALLKDCKLKPLALDAHANGINKLVQRNVELAKEKSSKWNWKLAAFVDLGQELTEISILSPDKLLFNRMIPYGSGYMDNELMKQLDVSETALVLKKQELADLSRTDFIGEEARRLNEIIRPYANRVTNEIQTVIQFYSGRVVEKRPEIVYLYGGNAHLKSLAELMEQTLGIPVRLFNDVAAISASPKAGQLDILSHANACAALLRND